MKPSSPNAAEDAWRIIEAMPVDMREALFRELEMFPPDYYAAGIDFTDVAALRELATRAKRELAEVLANGLKT